MKAPTLACDDDDELGGIVPLLRHRVDLLERDGVTVSAFLVEHDPVKPAFGYRVEGGGRSVVVSGDTFRSRFGLRSSWFKFG